MRVISKSRLREFWEGRDEAAQRALSAWHQQVEDAEWSSPNELRAQVPSADFVGDCVVFNVGGNKFRVICRLRYGTGIAYILKVMDHAEYSRNRWAEECGCHAPPPPRAQPDPGPRGVKKGRTPKKGA